MPVIPKRKDFKNKYKSKAKEPPRDIDSTRVAAFYNSKAYRDFRRLILQLHPVCELSLLNNEVISSNHVHHLIKWSQQTTDELKWQLLLDEDNVICIDGHVHELIHYNPEGLTPDQKAWLEKKKSEVYSKYMSRGIVINMTEDSNIKLYFQG